METFYIVMFLETEKFLGEDGALVETPINAKKFGSRKKIRKKIKSAKNTYCIITRRRLKVVRGSQKTKRRKKK